MNIYFNIFSVMCVVIGIISLIKLMLFKLENSMIFQPNPINEFDAKEIINDVNENNNITNHKLNTIDGEILDVLFYKNRNTDKLMLYFHGNAGNMYDEIELLSKLGTNCSVLIFDYRGYGLSTGSPSENGIHSDILTVWFYVTEQLNYKPHNVVFYGRSLGCAFALWLGKKIIKSGGELPKGIIIESGFYNFKTIAGELFLFGNYLTQSKLDNIKYIQKINKKIPILIIHSQDDEIININHAFQILKDGGYNRNNLVIISGGHNNLIKNEEYFKSIDSFIR